MGAKRIGSIPSPREATIASLRRLYGLTILTPDKKGIAKPGAVLILKKGPIIMTTLWTDGPYLNIYRNAEVTPNAALESFRAWSLSPGVARKGVFTKTLVAGQEVFVTSIDATSFGVVFDLFSDSDSRPSYAPIFFPFANPGTPSLKEALTLIAELFDVRAPN